MINQSSQISIKEYSVLIYSNIIEELTLTGALQAFQDLTSHEWAAWFLQTVEQESANNNLTQKPVWEFVGILKQKQKWT